MLKLDRLLVAIWIGTLHVRTMVGTATAGTVTGSAHDAVVWTVRGVLIGIMLSWIVGINRDGV